MKEVPYILTKSSVTILLDGISHTVRAEDNRFVDVVHCLKQKKYKELPMLLSKKEGFKKYSNGSIVIKDGTLTYKGKPLHNSLANRIVECFEGDVPFESLLNFLKNLLQNPSNRAVEETYKFLENKNLPITDDGCFIGYKAVREDFTDKYSGTISNKIGEVVEVPRNSVNDDPNNGCSTGLHVGSINYVDSFATGNDKKVLVKVNPKDVVCVPHEDFRKVRVCKYVVVSEYRDPISIPCVKVDKIGSQPVKFTKKFANSGWKKMIRDEFGRFFKKTSKNGKKKR